MAREMFGLSLGFVALILLTAHGDEHPDLSLLPPLSIAAEATLPEAPR
jgi:hypothetical protein